MLKDKRKHSSHFRTTMRVAIIGAGFSGLTTAKTLRDLGHECVVLEKCADVGGVWSAERRYPGLQTQNTKETYCLSDLAMPKRYGQWPEGREVQEYLESYVTKNKMQDLLRLNAEVVDVSRKGSLNGSSPSQLWTVKTKDGEIVEAEHVVVCTGIFNAVDVPAYAGAKDFKAAGGRICHTSEINGFEEVRGKNVLVVGYGKSACDVACTVARDDALGAASTTLVARRLIWKVPRRIAGLTYKWLLLTRMGEALFEYMRPANPIESFFHHTRIGKVVRNSLMDSLEWVIKTQLGLPALGLVPNLPFETVAQSTISLATVGFYEKVRKGLLTVRRDCVIEEVTQKDGRWVANLSDGASLPVDVIVCGTGFEQKPPSFLPSEIQQRLTDERGYWMLYRHIKPFDVPGLTFNGFGSSLFGATSSEASALWIGAYLQKGEVMLPSEEKQKTIVKQKLDWLDVRCQSKHSLGCNVVPFSMHTIDEVLDEANVNIGMLTRLMQWVFPIRPTSYAGLSQTLGQQLKSHEQDRIAKKLC
jgi:cation diffusion facilitator CzcD-associated flavoprotein CzcO